MPGPSCMIPEDQRILPRTHLGPGLRDQDGSADRLSTAIVVVVEHEARRHLTREALSADKPPGRLAIVEAIVAGCGGGEDDLRRFASAWRKLVMKDRATATVVQPAPADSPGRGRRPLSAAS
jgi:hypothetical protein